jgi:hypothetical protein
MIFLPIGLCKLIYKNDQTILGSEMNRIGCETGVKVEESAKTFSRGSGTQSQNDGNTAAI